MSLCSSCRRSLLARLTQPSRPFIQTSRRSFASVPASSNAAPANPPSAAAPKSTPAISSSQPGVSQPLTTPEISPQSTLSAAKADLKKAPGLKALPSSCPAGQTLRGVSYLKGVEPPVAKEDDEYPDWLWTILADNAAADGQLTKTHLSEMTKKQRAKYERKQERLRKSLPKMIPLHEQSIDLTPKGATAQESLGKRQELTKSQRDARRKGIREANFLKSM